MNKLPGIIDVSFEMETRMASVTYDPAEVGEAAIRAAISEADRRSAAEGEATPEVGLLLGEEDPGDDG